MACKNFPQFFIIVLSSINKIKNLIQIDIKPPGPAPIVCDFIINYLM